MAKKSKVPVTQAIRALRAANAEFQPHEYRYEPRGGTSTSSAELGVDEHVVIKTLVMQDEAANPYVILMHGDFEVATGLLAKAVGCKKIVPCKPEVAQKHSGYQTGGTSPFGLRNELPIYAESTIEALETLYINGGKRGLLVSMAGAELARILSPTWVNVAHVETGD